MDNLQFITDKSLRGTIEDAIEYIYALYEKSKGENEKELYKEETYRVIILYVISAIEAILLFFYKVRGEKLEYTEYKFVHPLSDKFFHKEKDSCQVVVAVQEKVEKSEHQIGLHDLVVYFKGKKLIQDKTAEEILELNEMRNTFHFSKPRTKTCKISDVESALKLLVHTISKAPLTLKIK